MEHEQGVTCTCTCMYFDLYYASTHVQVDHIFEHERAMQVSMHFCVNQSKVAFILGRMGCKGISLFP